MMLIRKNISTLKETWSRHLRLRAVQVYALRQRVGLLDHLKVQEYIMNSPYALSRDSLSEAKGLSYENRDSSLRSE